MPKFSTKKLEKIANDSWYLKPTAKATINYSFDIFKRAYTKGSILELGPAEGLMTKQLIKLTNNLTVVEGSKTFYDLLKKKYKKIDLVNCLFEDFTSHKKFDYIVLGHVLEHVENPVKVLKHIAQFLSPKGKLFTVVPNANSLHRQAAVLMKVIPSVQTFSQKDKHHGHLRIYTPESLASDCKKANLQIKSQGGYWLKTLPDSQIEKTQTPKQLRAFMELGEVYPAIAAEIYIWAGLKNK
jgi:2-polyprenyl-3-methyl-5-hydroxy-6-metoxy-1,4-benzoquinol methylase